MADVAMFPLGAVLFPHTPLALRLFEERYLMMLGSLLDEDDPEFGVVLIERGHEAGGGDQRFALGTMARITRVIPREGEIQLIAYGSRRIEVMEWLDDAPYPRATVRDAPELVWDENLAPLRTEAERIVRRVLARAAEFAEMQWDPEVELSDDPVESSWQLAAIAPLPQIDQYTLLRSTSTAQLLGTLIDLTSRPSLRSRHRSPTTPSTKHSAGCSTTSTTATTATTSSYQPIEPGMPLKGPATQDVTQPP